MEEAWPSPSKKSGLHDVSHYAYRSVSIAITAATQNEAALLRDVSARGICFYLDSAIEQGAHIGFTLTLPPEVTLTESIRVQCQGRVVRVEDAKPDGSQRGRGD